MKIQLQLITMFWLFLHHLLSNVSILIRGGVLAPPEVHIFPAVAQEAEKHDAQERQKAKLVAAWMGGNAETLKRLARAIIQFSC